MSPAIAKRCRAGVVTAGFSGGAVRAENVSESAFDLVAHPPLPPHERVRITLPVPGRHMIGNALLAAAVGFFLGLTPSEIKTGLESASLPAGRLEHKVVAGLVFLDDSYNANPDSMKAALATLASIPCAGRRIAVLGRMGELGPHAHAGHEAVGRAARDYGIDFLITVGDDDARLIHEAFANPDRSRRLATHREAGAFLLAAATRDDLILLKGSRFAGMERVLDAVASGC
jgi:UDP-N-acetylmuramoyl-tripeptide--D-alanyl-D-alanine ligase